MSFYSVTVGIYPRHQRKCIKVWCVPSRQNYTYCIKPWSLSGLLLIDHVVIYHMTSSWFSWGWLGAGRSHHPAASSIGCPVETLAGCSGSSVIYFKAIRIARVLIFVKERIIGSVSTVLLVRILFRFTEISSCVLLIGGVPPFRWWRSYGVLLGYPCWQLLMRLTRVVAVIGVVLWSSVWSLNERHCEKKVNNTWIKSREYVCWGSGDHIGARPRDFFFGGGGKGRMGKYNFSL